MSSEFSSDPGDFEHTAQATHSQRSERGSTALSSDNEGRMLESSKKNIQVAVRVRPLLDHELRSGDQVAIRTSDRVVEELDMCSRPTGRLHHYDSVFGMEVATGEVYDRACKSIVQGSLQGYNGTIFAYGQTSSGKTHTIMGDVEMNPGVIPLAIGDVFRWTKSGSARRIHVSYMEIYNETITDLFQKETSKATNLKIYEDKAMGPQVKDLTEIQFSSEADCIDALLEAETRRSFGSTALNQSSSRSHTLFRMRVEVQSGGHEEVCCVNLRTVATAFMRAQEALNSDHASLYFVDRATNELYIHAGDITLRLPISSGIAGAAATSKRLVNIKDAYQDTRFNNAVDKKTGYRTKSILAHPILHNGEVVGVVQFLNKTEVSAGVVAFTDADEQLVQELTADIGPCIAAAQQNAKTAFMGRLNLVDLAGCERQKQAQNTGATFLEGAYINTSLMTLGLVINVLSKGGAKAELQHVPFRNSKLTHLLSTSLGGNSNTCMICALAPAAKNRSETLSTLQFASRAKKIVNNVVQNTRQDQETIVRQYEAEIAKLRTELRLAAAAATVRGSIEVEESSRALVAELASARNELQQLKAELYQTRAERDNLLQGMGQHCESEDAREDLRHENCRDGRLSDSVACSHGSSSLNGCGCNGHEAIPVDRGTASPVSPRAPMTPDCFLPLPWLSSSATPPPATATNNRAVTLLLGNVGVSAVTTAAQTRASTPRQTCQQKLNSLQPQACHGSYGSYPTINGDASPRVHSPRSQPCHGSYPTINGDASPRVHSPRIVSRVLAPTTVSTVQSIVPVLGSAGYSSPGPPSPRVIAPVTATEWRDRSPVAIRPRSPSPEMRELQAAVACAKLTAGSGAASPSMPVPVISCRHRRTQSPLRLVTTHAQAPAVPAFSPHLLGSCPASVPVAISPRPHQHVAPVLASCCTPPPLVIGPRSRSSVDRTRSPGKKRECRGKYVMRQINAMVWEDVD